MAETKEEIFAEVSSIMEKLFEIEPGKIRPDSRLFEDLELDSIDAVDLAVQLQKKTGRRFKPEDVHEVRTVDDLVRKIEALLAEKA